MTKRGKVLTGMRYVPLLALSVVIAGCVTTTQPLQTKESSSLNPKEDPLFAIWWVDHRHHEHAGYRLYWALWEDGVVLHPQSLRSPGIDLQVGTLSAEQLNAMTRAICASGFASTPEGVIWDSDGWTIMRGRQGPRWHTIGLNQPPAKYLGFADEILGDDRDRITAAWNAVIEAIEEHGIADASEPLLNKSDRGGCFRGYSSTAKTSWMSD